MGRDLSVFYTVSTQKLVVSGWRKAPPMGVWRYVVSCLLRIRFHYFECSSISYGLGKTVWEHQIAQLYEPPQFFVGLSIVRSITRPITVGFVLCYRTTRLFRGFSETLAGLRHFISVRNVSSVGVALRLSHKDSSGCSSGTSGTSIRLLGSVLFLPRCFVDTLRGFYDYSHMHVLYPPACLGSGLPLGCLSAE